VDQGRILGQDASWFRADPATTEHTLAVAVPVLSTGPTRRRRRRRLTKSPRPAARRFGVLLERMQGCGG
jgi:hypothetical protein